MLPIKKIYIDSRDKTSDSASHTDFRIQLPMSISLPPNTGFYLTDVTIPVSFYTIESNRNQNIYFKVGNINYFRKIPIGNYSTTRLNQIIVDVMNSTYPKVGNAYPTKFASEPDIFNNTVNIKNLYDHFKLLTDMEAETAIKDSLSSFDTYGTDYEPSLPLYSINSMLQNNTIKPMFGYYTSGYVDLFPIRNLYIVSQTLGTYNSVSSKGEWSIIKKVPVRGSYNEMIYDQTVLGMDYLDCSNQSLLSIDFKIKDSYGNVINLHGNHWSFSIIFVKINDE